VNLAGAVFAMAPEMASLINAGHVLKIATISVAPWAFYFLEKGFQRRRVIWFMTTGLVLALQFFYTHWQIAYYTCLAVGIYGIVSAILILRREAGQERVGAYRLIGMNLVTLFFFLSTVAISLMPLANWSTDTNRGVQSGANQGKGGLNRDEAMSWSMPPEELGAFVIPGFFGFSRQEAGPNPDNIRSYYWGRMVFTQTTSYLGLLPWLLLPLPLIFGVALSAAAAVLLGGSMALRARRAPVVSGAENLMDAQGEVLEVVQGQAWARVHGERWQVRSDARLHTGQRVRVLALKGLVLDVQPVGGKGETAQTMKETL